MPIDQATFDALKGLWETVGGLTGESDLAAAIAFAESAGCQYALAGPVDIRPVKICTWNRTNGENSCGYWQINLWAHPAYHAPYIFDMYENARAAVAISDHGRDFGAWSTYTNRAYVPYLAQFGGDAAAPPPAPQTGDPSVDLSNIDSLEGWAHLSDVLGRRVPRQLALAQRYRHATLRAIATRSKVR